MKTYLEFRAARFQALLHANTIVQVIDLNAADFESGSSAQGDGHIIWRDQVLPCIQWLSLFENSDSCDSQNDNQASDTTPDNLAVETKKEGEAKGNQANAEAAGTKGIIYLFDTQNGTHDTDTEATDAAENAAQPVVLAVDQVVGLRHLDDRDFHPMPAVPRSILQVFDAVLPSSGDETQVLRCREKLPI